MAYKNLDQQKTYQIEWRKKRREDWILEHGPCRNCGGKQNLQIDHINPLEKVSHKIWTWSKEKREKELSKCQVLCFDCHVRKTSDFRWNKVKREHGTQAFYKHGCRCDPCRIAHNAYVLSYKKTGKSQKCNSPGLI